MTETHPAPTSLRSFYIVWVGQMVSQTGTTLTGFGLQLYVFAETGSVTQLTFVALAFTLPGVLFAPIAGTVADRFDRRLVMLLADIAGGAATAGLFVAYLAGSVELWQIYLATGAASTANTFQNPAWSAAVPLLVPKARLGRANGLVQLNQGVAIVLAPALAGALLSISGLGAVLVVDLATFGVAVVTLAVVRFPAHRRSELEAGSVRQDARFAWRYLRERSGLLALLWMYAGVNFMMSATNILLIPLVVSFSTEAAAGAILSVAGAGAVAGSLAVGVFGTPHRKVIGITGGIFVSGIITGLVGVRASVPLIAVASVLLLVLNPVINAMSQELWQTKVEEGVQGRVFALRFMIGTIVSPLGVFLAGPLADGVFEPLLAEDGALSSSVGEVIGTGPGRGIGFLYVLAGIGIMAIAVIGWSLPRLRNIESELSDVAGRE